jgi:ketosteroid isomerase-like protein
MTEHRNAALIRSAYEAVERGDMATFAAALGDDIVWHESTPGFEGDYHGRDETLALLGRVFDETGMELNGIRSTTSSPTTATPPSSSRSR